MAAKLPGRIAVAAILGLGGCAAGAVAAGPAASPEPNQEKVRWLAENAVAVRSIAPADESFADLMPLVARIGASRVVALGEATHGDGSTFLAKARLIRFLHQVMGFDVLAWESGFFDVPVMAAALRSDVPLPDAAARGLYQIWSKSAEVQPVLAYLRATQGTARPLQVVGFDCRVATARSRSELFPAFLFEFFDRLDPVLLSKAERADLTAMSVGLVPADVYEHPGERRYNRELPAADAGSVEGLLHATGKPWLFLGLRDLPAGHWLRAPLSTGFYFHEAQVTDLPRLFDAVFFLDEMTPSHALP